MAGRGTLGERLDRARQRRFVGRRAELELFAGLRQALDLPEDGSPIEALAAVLAEHEQIVLLVDTYEAAAFVPPRIDDGR